ncbi:MarR family transcriptional regulator [Egibacter rhizosphaerae]|uniref:MarR family transcriptional regulator n=1 Tax=Egibacter rhizosphaerae TaxID=1670831 RepID=A0A411YGD3_9ACTN|nr:MarR family winged helix-turn-helix transcriptional regulator [Egibacter rhizosphaerae]QBI20345.1 MarR family transcriptional regulator [Egibacter rhizosphaerae]
MSLNTTSGTGGVAPRTSEPRWLDDRELAAWRGFVRMQGRLATRLNRELLAAAGLSLADYEVLVHLSEASDGRLRSFQLCELTDWEKSRLSHHLKRMERRGLVSREGCESDRRGDYVVLTAYGRETIEAAAPAHVEHVRRYLIDLLDPQQLDALASITTTVLERLGEPDGHA